MKPFTPEEHRDSLIRRRIKFVVEKGAMARLFKAGSSLGLQEELFTRLKPEEIAKIQSQDEYDNWLIGTIELDSWTEYSRNGIEVDRWGYFAKLITLLFMKLFQIVNCF